MLGKPVVAPYGAWIDWLARLQRRGYFASRCVGLKTTLTLCLGERRRTTGACEGSKANRNHPDGAPGKLSRIVFNAIRNGIFRG